MSLSAPGTLGSLEAAASHPRPTIPHTKTQELF